MERGGHVVETKKKKIELSFGERAFEGGLEELSAGEEKRQKKPIRRPSTDSLELFVEVVALPGGELKEPQQQQQQLALPLQRSPRSRDESSWRDDRHVKCCCRSCRGGGADARAAAERQEEEEEHGRRSAALSPAASPKRKLTCKPRRLELGARGGLFENCFVVGRQASGKSDERTCRQTMAVRPNAGLPGGCRGRAAPSCRGAPPAATNDQESAPGEGRPFQWSRRRRPKLEPLGTINQNLELARSLLGADRRPRCSCLCLCLSSDSARARAAASAPDSTSASTLAPGRQQRVPSSKSKTCPPPTAVDTIPERAPRRRQWRRFPPLKRPAQPASPLRPPAHSLEGSTVDPSGLPPPKTDVASPSTCAPSQFALILAQPAASSKTNSSGVDFLPANTRRAETRLLLGAPLSASVLGQAPAFRVEVPEWEDEFACKANSKDILDLGRTFDNSSGFTRTICRDFNKKKVRFKCSPENFAQTENLRGYLVSRSRRFLSLERRLCETHSSSRAALPVGRFETERRLTSTNTPILVLLLLLSLICFPRLSIMTKSGGVSSRINLQSIIAITLPFKLPLSNCFESPVLDGNSAEFLARSGGHVQQALGLALAKLPETNGGQSGAKTISADQRTSKKRSNNPSAASLSISIKPAQSVSSEPASSKSNRELAREARARTREEAAGSGPLEDREAIELIKLTGVGNGIDRGNNMTSIKSLADSASENSILSSPEVLDRRQRQEAPSGQQDEQQQQQQQQQQRRQHKAHNWSFVGLVGFMFIGATGNILVCVAVLRDRRLQTATNYFLLSLAVADLLVCTLVMPFGIIYEFYGHWPFDWRICNLWVTLDVLTCSSSILHMCFISVGRYLGIRNPLHARQANLFVSRRAVLWRIGIAWLSSALIASPITMMSLYDHKNIVPGSLECAISNKYFQIFGSLIAFFLPMFVMVPSYVMTVRLLSQRAKFVRNNSLLLTHPSSASANHNSAKPQHQADQRASLAPAGSSSSQQANGGNLARAASFRRQSGAAAEPATPTPGSRSGAREELVQTTASDMNHNKQIIGPKPVMSSLLEAAANQRKEESTSDRPQVSQNLPDSDVFRLQLEPAEPNMALKQIASKPAKYNAPPNSHTQLSSLLDLQQTDACSSLNKNTQKVEPASEDKNLGVQLVDRKCGRSICPEPKGAPGEESSLQDRERESLLVASGRERLKEFQFIDSERMEEDCEPAGLEAGGWPKRALESLRKRSIAARDDNEKTIIARQTAAVIGRKLSPEALDGPPNSIQDFREQQHHPPPAALVGSSTRAAAAWTKNAPDQFCKTKLCPACRLCKVAGQKLEPGRGELQALLPATTIQMGAREQGGPPPSGGGRSEATSVDLPLLQRQAGSDKRSPLKGETLRKASYIDEEAAADQQGSIWAAPANQCQIKSASSQTNQKQASSSRGKRLSSLKASICDTKLDWQPNCSKCLQEGTSSCLTVSPEVGGHTSSIALDDETIANKCRRCNKRLAYCRRQPTCCNKIDNNNDKHQARVCRHCGGQALPAAPSRCKQAASRVKAVDRMDRDGAGSGSNSMSGAKAGEREEALELLANVESSSSPGRHVWDRKQSVASHLRDLNNNNNLYYCHCLSTQKSHRRCRSDRGNGHYESPAEGDSEEHYQKELAGIWRAREGAIASSGSGLAGKIAPGTDALDHQLSPLPPAPDRSGAPSLPTKTEDRTCSNGHHDYDSSSGRPAARVGAALEGLCRRGCCCSGHRNPQACLPSSSHHSTSVEKETEEEAKVGKMISESLFDVLPEENSVKLLVREEAGIVSGSEPIIIKAPNSAPLSHKLLAGQLPRAPEPLSNHANNYSNMPLARLSPSGGALGDQQPNLNSNLKSENLLGAELRPGSGRRHRQGHKHHHHHHRHHHNQHHYRHNHHHHHHHHHGHHRKQRQEAGWNGAKEEAGLDGAEDHFGGKAQERRSEVRDIELGEDSLLIDDFHDERPHRKKSVVRASDITSSIMAAAIPILPSSILNSNAERGTSSLAGEPDRSSSLSAGHKLRLAHHQLRHRKSLVDLAAAAAASARQSSASSASGGPALATGSLTQVGTSGSAHLSRKQKQQQLNASSVDTANEPQIFRYLGSSMQVRNEQKATKVLGVVFFTFVVCWTPFFVINIVQGFVERDQLAAWVSDQMMTTFQWLGYISSTINPVIYTVFNRNFRRAFRYLLLCKKPNNRLFDVNKSFRISQHGNQRLGAANCNQGAAAGSQLTNVNSTSMCATQLLSSMCTPSPRPNYPKGRPVAVSSNTGKLPRWRQRDSLVVASNELSSNLLELGSLNSGEMAQVAATNNRISSNGAANIENANLMQNQQTLSPAKGVLPVAESPQRNSQGNTNEQSVIDGMSASESSRGRKSEPLDHNRNDSFASQHGSDASEIGKLTSPSADSMRRKNDHQQANAEGEQTRAKNQFVGNCAQSKNNNSPEMDQQSSFKPEGGYNVAGAFKSALRNSAGLLLSLAGGGHQLRQESLIDRKKNLNSNGSHLKHAGPKSDRKRAHKWRQTDQPNRGT